MYFDDSQILFILGFFVIFLLIIYLYSFIIRATLEDYTDEAIYLDSTTCNNGDLVFVSYYTPAGVIISSVSRSIWSHPGIIWVDDKTGIRYVLEGAIYKQKKYRHFYKIPLENWLYINKRSTLGYKKYTGEPLDSKYMIEKFDSLMGDCKLASFDVFWARFLIDREHYEYSKNEKYTCSEGVVILGQEIGIFEKDKIYCSYLPGDLANDNIKLCKNSSYSKIVEVCQHPSERISIFEDTFFYKNFWKN